GLRHLRPGEPHLPGHREAGGRRPRPAHRGRGVPRPRRPVRVRQVHQPADARRPGGRRPGRHHDRRPQGHEPEVQGPRHRDGVPELCPLSAHDGRGQHGLRAEDRRGGQGGDLQAGRRGREDPRPGAVPRPPAEAALRWPAPTGRHGPGHRPVAPGVPDGRAAVQPGREAAGADPHPDRGAAASPGHDDGLRDPRPGGGDDHGGPGRGPARRPPRAVRHAASAVPGAGQCLRRGLHRLPGHEHRGVPPGGRARGAGEGPPPADHRRPELPLGGGGRSGHRGIPAGGSRRRLGAGRRRFPRGCGGRGGTRLRRVPARDAARPQRQLRSVGGRRGRPGRSRPPAGEGGAGASAHPAGQGAPVLPLDRPPHPRL
ncbi:MAG: Various polyols ABC transporter, ATP-binding protein, partial [uncultured Blastococcus sp.]